MTVVLFSELDDEDKNFIVNELTKGKCRPNLDSRAHNVFPRRTLQQKLKKILGLSVKNMTRAEMCGLLFNYRSLFKAEIDKGFKLDELKRQLSLKDEEIKKLKGAKSPGQKIKVKTALEKKQLKQAQSLLEKRDKEIDELEAEIAALEKALKSKKTTETDELNLARQAAKDRVSEIKSERDFLAKSVDKLAKQLDTRDANIAKLQRQLSKSKSSRSRGGSETGSGSGPGLATLGGAAALGAVGVGAATLAARNRIKTLESEIAALKQQRIEVTPDSLKKVEQLQQEVQAGKTRMAQVQAEKQALEEELENIQSGLQATGPGTGPLSNQITEGLRKQLSARNEKISKLEQEINKLQQDKQIAQQKLIETEQKAKMMEQQIVRLEKEINDATQKTENNITQLETKRNGVQKQLVADSEELGNLQKIIEQQVAEIEKLKKERQAEINERNRQVKALQLQVSSREQRIADLERARDQVIQQAKTSGVGINKEVLSLQNRIQEIQRDREKAIGQFQRRISELESKINSITSEIQVKNNEIAKFQAQAQREKSQLEVKFNAQLAKKQQEIQKLNTQINSLQNQLGQAKAQFAAASQGSGSQIKDLQREIQKKNQEINTLQQRVSTRPKEIEAAEQKVKQLEAEINKLQKATEASSSQARVASEQVVKGLEQQVAELKQQRNQREQNISSSENKVKELESQITQLKNEKATRDQEISSLKTKLESETKKLRAEISLKEKEVDTLNNRVSQLQQAANAGRVPNLSNDLQQAESKLNDVQQSVLDLQSKLEIKTKALQNLEKANEKIQNEFKSQIARKDTEINRLNNKIEELNSIVSNAKKQEKQMEQIVKADDGGIVKKLNEEINILKKQIQEQKEMERREEQAVAKKEQEIATMKQEITALKQKGVETSKEITAKNQEINTLRSQVKSAGKQQEQLARIKQLESLLSEKEKQVSELEEEIQKVQEAKQSGAVPTQAAQGTSLGISPELLTLRKQINEKDSEIRQLKEASKTVSKAGETQVRIANEKVEQLQKELEVQDRKAQQQIDEGTKRINSLNAELVETKQRLESALKTVEKEKANSQEQIRIKNTRIQELEKDIDELSNIKPGQVVETGIDEKIVQQKDALISDLERQLREKEKSISDSKAEIAKLNQQIKDELVRFEKEISDKEEQIRKFQKSTAKLLELEARVEAQFSTIENLNREKQERIAKITAQSSELSQLREGAKTAEQLQGTIGKLSDELKSEKVKTKDLEAELKRVRASTSEEIEKRSREALERIRRLEEEKKAAEEAAAAEAKLREEEEKVVGVCEKELQELQDEIAKLTELEKGTSSTIQSLTKIIDRGGLKTVRNDTVRNRVSNRNKYSSEKETLNEFKEIASKAKNLKSPADCKDVVSSLKTIRQKKGEIQKIARRVQNDWEDVRGVGRVYLRMKGETNETNRNEKYVEASGKEIVIRDTNRCDVQEEVGGDRFGPFTAVFDERTSNEKIFEEEVRETIQNIYTGYRVVIFTYGQTGAGKSFTLLGSGLNNKGMAQRSLDILVKLANDGLVDKIDISARQIYKLQLYDVFKTNQLAPVSGPKPQREFVKFNLGEQAKLRSANVPSSSIEIFKVGDSAALLQRKFATEFKRIQSRRPTRQTDANPESSRSHLFVTLTIKFGDKLAKQLGRTETQLTFVDVAGNEQFKEAKGESSLEGAEINKTLKVMIDSLTAYAEGKDISPGQARIMSDLVKDVINFDETKLLTKVIMFLNIHTFFVNESGSAAQIESRKNVNNRICTTTADTLNIGQTLMSHQQKSRPRIKK